MGRRLEGPGVMPYLQHVPNHTLSTLTKSNERLEEDLLLFI